MLGLKTNGAGRLAVRSSACMAADCTGTWLNNRESGSPWAAVAGVATIAPIAATNELILLPTWRRRS
jgi:hypothetical protein